VAGEVRVGDGPDLVVARPELRADESVDEPLLNLAARVAPGIALSGAAVGMTPPAFPGLVSQIPVLPVRQAAPGIKAPGFRQPDLLSGVVPRLGSMTPGIRSRSPLSGLRRRHRQAPEASREQRLRRLARKQGLTLIKSVAR
jgi:hypothetical protein